MTNKPTAAELRELDNWIAENVMGWKILPSDNWRGDGSEPTNYPCEWRPTQDPAAAFEVLKKCGKKWVGSVRIKCLESKEFYTVQVYKTDSKTAWITGNAETLELAIAKFSLALFSKSGIGK